MDLEKKIRRKGKKEITKPNKTWIYHRVFVCVCLCVCLWVPFSFVSRKGTSSRGKKLERSPSAIFASAATSFLSSPFVHTGPLVPRTLLLLWLRVFIFKLFIACVFRENSVRLHSVNQNCYPNRNSVWKEKKKPVGWQNWIRPKNFNYSRRWLNRKLHYTSSNYTLVSSPVYPKLFQFSS